jgi:hypothetical protein
VTPRKCEKTGMYVPLTTFRNNDSESLIEINFGQQSMMDEHKWNLNGVGMKF